MWFSDIYATHVETSVVVCILLWPIFVFTVSLRKHWNLYISDSCPLITVSRISCKKEGKLIVYDEIFYSIIGWILDYLSWEMFNPLQKPEAAHRLSLVKSYNMYLN